MPRYLVTFKQSAEVQANTLHDAIEAVCRNGRLSAGCEGAKNIKWEVGERRAVKVKKMKTRENLDD